MSSLAAAAPISKGMLWTGRILSGLIVAFVLFATSYGFLKPEMSRQGMRDMGYPESLGTPITIVFLASTLLYAIPRTCVFGAILLTGYFGGAIATHVRLGQPTFVVALSMAVLAWLGIYLRDARLRALLPLRT
jgi:DoxX-like family